MKKFVKTICWIIIIAVFLIVLYLANVFFGNPVSYLLARKNASQFMEDNFGDSHFQITKVVHDFKTGSYYAYVGSPISQDSYFTIYFDEWGQYRYDSYEDVTNKNNTFYRINDQYWDLVRQNAEDRINQFDISIYFGEIKPAGVHEIFTYTDENSETREYTMDKEYGLDRSLLELDKEYDIQEIGRDCGKICLYIHDPEVTEERAAELLLEVKSYLDSRNVPFYAIDFNLCQPRNEEGQMVGQQITLMEFLYSDIHEDGLIDRVRESWALTQEHYAIQDGEKTVLNNG